MAVAEFMPARPAGSTIPSVLNAMGQGQSLMSRAQQMEQAKAEEARRQAEFALKLPLVEAQTKADLVSATTAYDSALRQQQMRATALSMFDKAQQDFDHINTIEDATVRARMSREWLSRYSQLANIKEIGPQVGQMNDLAVRNIEAPIKLAALKTAGEREFESLTSKMTPEQQTEAREIKAGLKARAVGSGPRPVNVPMPDGSTALYIIDPMSGQARPPTMEDFQALQGGAAAQPQAQVQAQPQAGVPQQAPSAQPTSPQTAIRSATPGQVERQKQDAQVASELQAAKPKRQAALRDAESAVSQIVSDLDELEKKVGASTVGLVAAGTSGVPSTPAYDFKIQLEGVLSRIASQALQKMREASPTGGALGNVSDKDLELLQSQLGGIRQGMSEREFIRALDKVRDRLSDTLTRQKQFFEEQYFNRKAIKDMTDEEIQAEIDALK